MSSAPEATPPPVVIDLQRPPEDWSQDQIDQYWMEHVYRPDEKQLTVRALVMGFFLGGIMSVANLYIGLRVGWSLGMAITSTILAFSMFKGLQGIGVIKDEFSQLENNTVASVASAAGYFCSAGMVSAIPALFITQQRELSFGELTIWMLAISFIGIVMAVPMRRQMIDVDRLRFPSGLACAETIRSMHETAGNAAKKARALVYGTVIAAIFEIPINIQKVGRWANPWTWKEQYGLLPITLAGKKLAAYTLQLNTSLLMYGAGAIMGIRVGLSLLIGALVIYGGLAPWLSGHGIVVINDAGGVPTYRAVMAWAVWPGVIMALVASLLQFALKWRTILQAFGALGRLAKRGAAPSRMAPVEVPSSWFLGGMALSTIFIVIAARAIFGIAPWLSVLAVGLSFILSIVACRATGETDVTPIGALGKITQLTFAMIAPGNYHTNLMTAAITAGSVSHSSDLLTDLKTSYVLGGAPKRQFMAQFVGIFAGALFCVPAYKLLVTPDTLGGKFPAPAAQTWSVFADLLAHGIADHDRGPGEAVAAELQGAAISTRPPGLVPGDSLILHDGPGAGTYTVEVVNRTTLVLDRDLPAGAWAARPDDEKDPGAYEVVFKGKDGAVRGTQAIHLVGLPTLPALRFTKRPAGVAITDWVRADDAGNQVYDQIKGFRGDLAYLEHPFMTHPDGSPVPVFVKKYALPPYALTATIIAVLFGILVTLLELYGPKKWKGYLPSITGLGIAAVIGGYDSVAMGIGAIIAWLFFKLRPKLEQEYNIPFSSGIIAGASIMGLVVAILQVVFKVVNQ